MGLVAVGGLGATGWAGTPRLPTRAAQSTMSTSQAPKSSEVNWSVGEGNFPERKEGPAGTIGNFMSIKRQIAGVPSINQRIDLLDFRPWTSILRHPWLLMALGGELEASGGRRVPADDNGRLLIYHGPLADILVWIVVL